MPEETEPRRTLIEHLVSDEGPSVRPRRRRPPEPEVIDDRPTYREQLLDEPPTFFERSREAIGRALRPLRARLARIQLLQWLTALALFFSVPLLSWTYTQARQGVMALDAWHDSVLALQAWKKDYDFELTERNAEHGDRLQAYWDYQLKLEKRKIMLQAKEQWHRWRAAFLGNNKAVCYESNNFDEETTGEPNQWKYQVSCFYGHHGDPPRHRVVCTQHDCNIYGVETEEPKESEDE